MKNGKLLSHGTPTELITKVGVNNLEDVYMAYLGGG